jgi:glycosyltransferase involved in cell wall biosynthesis
MKLAILVTRREKPSARYRIFQYLPYLEEQGWLPQVFVLPKKWREKRALFKAIDVFDLVVLQKKLLSYWDFSYLRRYARKLIYDFDDAILFRDSWKGSQTSLKRRWAFARTVQGADWVIAGNAYLSELAQRYTKRVSIVPTPVPATLYPSKDYALLPQGVTLGWIGSAGTIKYLGEIRGILDLLGERFPFVRLKVVSDAFVSFNRIRIEKKKWTSEDEISDLHSFDIGLMPLTDDSWSRGKCGFKMLQYMAAGIPVVCSPVGVNREIIQDGVQGYWAGSQDEWFKKLSVLIEDKILRERMGGQGRKRVEEFYSLEVNAPKLIEIFASL